MVVRRHRKHRRPDVRALMKIYESDKRYNWTRYNPPRRAGELDIHM